MSVKTDLKSLDRGALGAFAKGSGLPAYRAGQLIHWIYERNAGTIEEITEFSKKLRQELAAKAFISRLQLKTALSSEDGTRKFLFGLSDGNAIESVLIPDGKRLTLCISSQAGCRMGCGFCLTGKIGFKRDLLPHEIVDQFLLARQLALPETLTNIVFMGMGEPLDNLDNVAEAIKRITAFARFSKRRITVSTSGVAPGIREFAAKASWVKLAVSINAATDSVRSSIMPINRKYPLQKLIAALRDFPLAPRDRITIEYVLLKRVNDAQADAKALAGLLRGIPCKINLIPYNGPENCENGRAFNMPDENTTMAFQDVLVRAGHTAIIRKSKGKDILAACGQLAGKG